MSHFNFCSSLPARMSFAITLHRVHSDFTAHSILHGRQAYLVTLSVYLGQQLFGQLHIWGAIFAQSRNSLWRSFSCSLVEVSLRHLQSNRTAATPTCHSSHKSKSHLSALENYAAKKTNTNTKLTTNCGNYNETPCVLLLPSQEAASFVHLNS